MALPSIQSSNREFQLLQSKWGAQLNPLLAQPLSSCLILKDIQLQAGVNQINHLLDRQMQGWIIADKDSAAQIFRSQPLNSKTLTLNSDAACVITLVVF